MQESRPVFLRVMSLHGVAVTQLLIAINEEPGAGSCNLLQKIVIHSYVKAIFRPSSFESELEKLK